MVIYIAALMALSALTAMNLSSPRVIVICGLFALLCVELLRRTIIQLRCRQPIEEAPIKLQYDGEAISDSYSRLEARLEHAPSALFLMTSENELLAPLNNYARRMLAPGRVTDLNDFNSALRAVNNDRRNIIVFDTENGQERALVTVNYFHIGGVEERLIAVLPIESELENAAFKAWQQLVHVLTHEIMNSLTPVASLSRTAHDLMAELQTKLAQENQEVQELGGDLSIALDTISRRSDSLAGFVSSYRSLSNVPASLPQRTQLLQLFSRISTLLKQSWQSRNGAATFVVEPESLEIMIDPGQLEQAIINLLKNAEEATANTPNPQVSVYARLARGGRLRIEISDNGPGIPDELVAHIFTPFFTSRAKGNGIGLAMVRQLVHNNGGTVRYAKLANSGARFIMSF
ncbi:sensor histidine kinase [Undibacterium sp. Di26W]|uniref:sensor histidine kinase n=1 Tax=Undibacterium sp. Di26W TaxID=3413035 RepID=UPI003BEF945F